MSNGCLGGAVLMAVCATVGAMGWAAAGGTAHGQVGGQIAGATQPSAGERAEVRRAPQLLYATQCSSCHGMDLQGGGASSLIDGHWEYGVGEQQVFRRIKFGIEEMGMPAYEPAMSDNEIRGLTQFILAKEKEAGAEQNPGRGGDVLRTKDYSMNFEVVVGEGVRNPWGIAFVSATHALITEKGGNVRQLIDGKLGEPIEGIPASRSHGQGGMMAVSVDPEYATSGWVYLGYTQENPNGFLTRIVRGKIVDNRWTEQQVLWEGKAEHYSRAGVHFGTRIVFDKEGRLYFSIGDRGRQNEAQDVTRPNGKVHRINRDGSIPKDNPFVGRAGAYESIYSFGNRNPQGLAFHPVTGKLWATEHGPMGGDELNLIEAGKNYGWPVITYGKNYNGTIISNETHRDGMEQPAVQWTPSLAVCGLDFYTGDDFPKWQNTLLVGALAFQEVRKVTLDDAGKVVNQEVIVKNRGRVRDVKVAPDGAVWVLTNGPDRIVRLTAAK